MNRDSSTLRHVVRRVLPLPLLLVRRVVHTSSVLVTSSARITLHDDSLKSSALSTAALHGERLFGLDCLSFSTKVPI